MRGEDIASALAELGDETDVGAVVWDGARGHKGQQAQDVGLLLIVQPPYSPELNPAERVFEEVRRWIEGRMYQVH